MKREHDSINRSMEEAGMGGDSPDRVKLMELFSIRDSCPECSGIISGELDMKMIVSKRKQGVPLEYLLGVAGFMERLFYCTPDTLIPRADTSLLVETAISVIRRLQDSGERALEIIEIGTGCGNIAVMVASLSGNTIIHASDISEKAIRVARKNIKAYDLQERIILECGDMFEPFRGRSPVDIIICNPPYIPSGSLNNLGSEIIDHEPVLALDAGTYGVDIFMRLIRDSVDLLRPGGILAFEFGERQEKMIERMLKRSGNYHEVTFHEYDGVPRVASAIRKGDGKAKTGTDKLAEK